MEDRVICSCLDVTYNTIKEAIENGAKTLDDIKDETEAGTICGMCEDDIQEILDELEQQKQLNSILNSIETDKINGLRGGRNNSAGPDEIDIDDFLSKY